MPICTPSVYKTSIQAIGRKRGGEIHPLRLRIGISPVGMPRLMEYIQDVFENRPGAFALGQATSKLGVFDNGV
jgi:hypothetical protein